jgi:hypothetical protein
MNLKVATRTKNRFMQIQTTLNLSKHVPEQKACTKPNQKSQNKSFFLFPCLDPSYNTSYQWKFIWFSF